MIGKALLAGLVGLALTWAPKAVAQQVASTTATGSMPLLTLVQSSKPSTLQSADYYTQLEVSASMPGLPQTPSEEGVRQGAPRNARAKEGDQSNYRLP